MFVFSEMIFFLNSIFSTFDDGVSYGNTYVPTFKYVCVPMYKLFFILESDLIETKYMVFKYVLEEVLSLADVLKHICVVISISNVNRMGIVDLAAAVML